MTYRELLEKLTFCTQEQLDDDVTVRVLGMDEFFPVVGEVKEHHLPHSFDAGHLYLEIEG